MEHEHNHDHAEMFTAAYWDERYGSADRVWSGNPNPRLVTVAGDLTPGTALDVGCGEGADVIWLAARGWQVTGVDVSEVALKRAAEAAGSELADRITWQQADILTWTPEKAYDLVTAHFIHLPRPELTALHRRLADAVKPGGTLLIVGHHPLDIEAIERPKHVAALMLTAEDMAETFDENEWEIEATNPGRPFTDPDGNEVTLHDAVVRATKKA
ncbi:MAG: methyltransferase domain-containing protein [Hamadaea sp.]|uniref:class I SAM-dependent methyltransferase n=1 Tax=Hamadaea sp. TaxID=2024425 RepID=UPI0017915CAA|nr:class I SAM-dependent methyltransferase [Hamadaea sp.]NUT24309.1 methyltransferase domain-containing protein [Hamadaea sp.]